MDYFHILRMLPIIMVFIVLVFYLFKNIYEGPNFFLAIFSSILSGSMYFIQSEHNEVDSFLQHPVDPLRMEFR